MTVCLNFFAWHLQNSIFPICCARATNDHTIIFHLPNSAVAFYQPNLEKWNRIKISDNLNTLDADRHISYRTQQQRSPWQMREKKCEIKYVNATISMSDQKSIGKILLYKMVLISCPRSPTKILFSKCSKIISPIKMISSNKLSPLFCHIGFGRIRSKSKRLSVWVIETWLGDFGIWSHPKFWVINVLLANK